MLGDEEALKQMLTDLMELIRMVRDGDFESDNERAKEIYAELFAVPPSNYPTQ